MSGEEVVVFELQFFWRHIGDGRWVVVHKQRADSQPITPAGLACVAQIKQGCCLLYQHHPSSIFLIRPHSRPLTPYTCRFVSRVCSFDKTFHRPLIPQFVFPVNSNIFIVTSDYFVFVLLQFLGLLDSPQFLCDVCGLVFMVNYAFHIHLWKCEH